MKRIPAVAATLLALAVPTGVAAASARTVPALVTKPDRAPRRVHRAHLDVPTAGGVR